MTGGLAQQPQLGADAKVADLVAGPWFAGVGHARVDAAARGVGGDKQRPQVAVHALDGVPRREHVGAIAETIGNGGRERGDVHVPLRSIAGVASSAAAPEALAVGVGDGNPPESGVAVHSGGHAAALVSVG